MKYVKQFCWILLFTFLGELLHGLLPLPVPSGVYGLLLLLGALLLGLVKLSDVEESGGFLLDTMTMMFIPSAVGVMTVVELLLPVLIPYLVIILASTVLVMAVTAVAAERILTGKERKGEKR